MAKRAGRPPQHGSPHGHDHGHDHGHEHGSPHSYSRARATRLPARAAALTWPDLVEQAGRDDVLEPLLRRLRWSYFGGPAPMHIDPDSADPAPITAAEARFIEWALLDFVRAGESGPLIDDWLRRHVPGRARPERLEPWRRSLSGGFLVDALHDDGDSGVLCRIDDGLTFTTSGLRRLDLKRDDVVVGRILPDADASTWSLTPSAVKASVVPGADVRSRQASYLATLGPDAAAADPRDWSRDMPLPVERWLGATFAWPLQLIDNSDAVSWLGHLLEDLDSTLRSVFVARELADVDDPVYAWERVIEAVETFTLAEQLVLAHLIVAVWTTVNADAFARFQASAEPARLDAASRQAFALVAGTHQRRQREAAGEDVSRPDLPLATPWQPDEATRAAVAALPIDDTCWVGERRVVPLVRSEPDVPPHYWHAIIWMDDGTGEVVASELCPPDAPTGELWSVACRAMLAPSSGTPGRPAEMRCIHVGDAAEAREALGALGIDVDADYGEDEELEEAFAAFEKGLSRKSDYADDGRWLEGYLRLPGSPPDSVKALYEAAGEYYRARVSDAVAADTVVEVTIDGGAIELVAIISPKGDTRPGLVIYDASPDLLADALDDEAEPDELPGTYVEFSARPRVSRSLVQEAEGQGWPLVRGRYPVVAIRRDADGPARLVCGEEVGVLTAILLALAGWVREHGAAIGRVESGARGDSRAPDEAAVRAAAVVGAAAAAYETEAGGRRVRLTLPKSIPD